ncbi:MAG TPA: glycosyltransferase 87 family protein [Thermoleophilaceae bacterium]|nr:glycosyltransferase 87 family protein [Thermoleophilaceae bacterium]
MAALAVALAIGALPLPAPPAHAAGNAHAGAAQGPPPSLTKDLSAADRRDWARAIRIANRTESVRSQRERYPNLRSTSFSRQGRCCMSLWFTTRGRPRAAVRLDLRTGRILEQWSGWQAGWEMARGYRGDFGRSFNSPWILIPLGLLFLAPFFDPRRPFRLLHLDLLVLLAFGVSHVLFNAGRIGVSVPLFYPVLAYLLVRMLVIGFRPRAAHGPLVPLVPATWLVVGALLLFGARVALNVVDSNVLDVGYAGVIGANHIANGDELYHGHFAADPPAGDTYGPVMYLTYLPFERTIGWSGRWDDVPAAHGAAIAFDLLTLIGLLLLGRRLRAGPAGRALGGALAFAWVAYPYSLFALMTNTNDALVSALVVFALLFATSPPARGALIGLGTAAKLAPAALAPLFFNPFAERRARGPILYVAAFALVLVVTIVPFIPPGGLHELYDRTLGFQISRESPTTIWGQDPSLGTLHTVVELAAVNFAAALLIFPARKRPLQLAALAAAVLIAIQIAAVYWFYLYVVWFAPLVFVALFVRFGSADDYRAVSST